MNSPSARSLLIRVGVASVICVMVGLSGCAAQPDYDPAVAERLQSQVLALTTSSAEEDFAGALSSLNELEVDVKDALARGEITEARYQSIMAAAALVRADLDTAITARTPTEPPAPNDENNDNGNGNGDEDEDGDNSGPGNRKDREKGKGSGRD